MGMVKVAEAMGKRLRRIWRDCSAAEIAEAAFVLPILFAFIFAILQFSRAYMVYSAMQHAAQEGARAAAGATCATCGAGNIGNVPLQADQIATTVVGPILQNSHIDATGFMAPAVGARNACSGAAVACEALGLGATPAVCVQRNVILNESSAGTPPSGTPECGASVALDYPITFSLPSPMASAPYVTRRVYSLNLKAQAQVKGEN